MDNSILNSTKKILGLPPGYDAFDHDVVTHINATLSIINQLGVGVEGGLFIEDANAVWSDIGAPADQIALIRTYVFLKVGILFDPPTTSFLLDAKKEQIREYEWRLSMLREVALPDTA